MDQKRLLIAFVLSAVILFGWTYLFPPPTPEQQNANTSQSATASPTPAPSQQTAQADAQMTGLLSRLFAVAEAYPELKANTTFLQLQDQLANIEGELQGARRYYNATVRDLNSTIQSFPPVLIARPAGFTEEPFYQDEDPSIQSVPKVSFVRPAA